SRNDRNADGGRAVLLLVGVFRLAFASLFARLLPRFPSLRLWSLKDSSCHLLEVLQSFRPFCVLRLFQSSVPHVKTAIRKYSMRGKYKRKRQRRNTSAQAQSAVAPRID